MLLHFESGSLSDTDCQAGWSFWMLYFSLICFCSHQKFHDPRRRLLQPKWHWRWEHLRGEVWGWKLPLHGNFFFLNRIVINKWWGCWRHEIFYALRNAVLTDRLQGFSFCAFLKKCSQCKLNFCRIWIISLLSPLDGAKCSLFSKAGQFHLTLRR